MKNIFRNIMGITISFIPSLDLRCSVTMVIMGITDITDITDIIDLLDIINLLDIVNLFDIINLLDITVIIDLFQK